MPRVVQVTAPSRLHFGLWSLAGSSGRQFGGVGAMVQQPGLRLRIERCEGPARQDRGIRVASPSPLAPRAELFAHRWARFHGIAEPDCGIHIEAAPPEHVGLGTGTQLGLAVATGLGALCDFPSQTAQELALSVGRGLRSAVGTYGFVLGGLVVEQGKLPEEVISPLDCRIDLAQAWRFVLVRPANGTGLAGDDEASAIESLGVVPADVTGALMTLVHDKLVPAAATEDFSSFAASLYRYGNQSGHCFAARQGGPYNGPELTQIVERIQALGFEGAGQTSWGPTLYVATPDQSAAEDLAELLRLEYGSQSLEVSITRPCNQGAKIDVIDAT